jgi:hypothetical protein
MFSAWTTLANVLAYFVSVSTFMTEAIFEPHWQTKTPILGPSGASFFFSTVFRLILGTAAFLREGALVFLGVLFHLQIHPSLDRVSCSLGAFRLQFFGHFCG